MAFNGKYEIESEKNYDEFMKCLGEWGPWTARPVLGQEPELLGSSGLHFVYSFLHSLTYGATILSQAQAVKNRKTI